MSFGRTTSVLVSSPVIRRNMLRNYFKIAFRNLAKNKVFSFINILGLAVGMAVAMMIGLWIYDELSFNKFHKSYDRLAQLFINQTFNGSTGTGRAVSIPSATEIKTKYASNFKYVSMASWRYGHLLVNGEKMLKGSASTALKEPRSILLSESIAKALFDEADPMNKIIKIDSKNNVKVTGVFEDLPFNSEFHQVKFYLTWSDYLADEGWVRESQQQWSNHSFQCFAQIAENTTMAGVSAKIRDVEKKHTSAQENPEYFLHPMSRWHLYSDFKDGKNNGGGIQFVWLFSIIGAFVLLLACINFMNLSTARSEKRAKEVGIRKAVGSVRSQLVSQFLSESFLVVAFAFVLSIILVQLVLPYFNDVADKKTAILWTNPWFWLLGIGFSLFTGLLSGSYPALYLSSFQPVKVLKGTFRVGRFASVPRKVLVVIQFTVSVTLIIGTIIVFRQIQFSKNRPIGYDRSGLVMIDMPTLDIHNRFDAFRNELLQTNVVVETAKTTTPTTEKRQNENGFSWSGKSPSLDVPFVTFGVTYEFGKTVDWKIREGRDFSRKISSDALSVVLNESAVKLMGFKHPVGETIRWGNQPLTVVGVVKDMIMESPYEPVKQTIYYIAPWPAYVLNIKLKPTVSASAALERVETVFRKYAPAVPFDYKFVDAEYDAKFRAEERIGKLASFFAVLAIFISCLGLFGLASFVAEQRTKEIGIRKVLGASVTNVWGLLSKDFVTLVIIAFFIAAPIAWYFLSDWLQKYQYHTEMSWWIFALSGLGAMAITLLTVSFQAIKAALVNPVISLRSE
jgi:putative ABC transport system permease protein